jgi:hypothetical protein
MFATIYLEGFHYHIKLKTLFALHRSYPFYYLVNITLAFQSQIVISKSYNKGHCSTNGNLGLANHRQKGFRSLHRKFPLIRLLTKRFSFILTFLHAQVNIS